jgi:hypothetical protein
MPEHTLTYPAQPGPISLDQITDADRAAFRELGRDAKLVIEVGTFLGGSAEELFAGMPDDGHLVTIDTFCGTANSGVTDRVPPDKMLNYAVGRLWQYQHRMNVIIGDSRATAAMFKPGIADVVFLDAAHDYGNVVADIDAWRPIVRPGGVLAGHDFDRSLLECSEEELWEHREYETYKGLHHGVAFAVRKSFPAFEISGDSVWRVTV